MALPDNELLTGLLKDVSRSFYLTLSVLPKSVRDQIGLAYLLARTTDTIADTEIVPLERRLTLLEILRDRIMGRTAAHLDLTELARTQGSPAECVLLTRVEDALQLLTLCEEKDRALIREVINTITSGQVLDLRRFAGASKTNIIALQLDDELDDYTYRVAGCVGEFWTKICLQNQFRGSEFLAKQSVTEHDFEKLGVRFGKGLQLVNILRDLPVDLRNGRCYVPEEKLNAASLIVPDLLDSKNETRFRPLYNELLDRAEAHLTAGWKYTTLLPRGEFRIRLACAWPVLIGLKTIKLLRTRNVLDPAKRIKISRADVRGVLFWSIVQYPFASWEKLPRRI